MVRAYDNRQRRAALERQRRAVLEAMAAELLDHGDPITSLRGAAARAGVGLRTAQRYFPDVESRVGALAEHLEQVMGPVDHPLETVDDIPGFIRAAYARAGRHWAWTTALARTGWGNEVRLQFVRPRRRRYAELLTGLGAPAELAERCTAMIALLASSEAGLPLVEVHGLSVEQAGEVAADTAAALIGSLRAAATDTARYGGIRG